VHVAYQVVGDGPVDLVTVPPWIHQVERIWEEPAVVRSFERLASFSRLILFDRRGTGLSDPVEGAATLEQRMDDVRAVMDEVGSERAWLYGYSEGGPMSVLFAATYPERTEGLILYGTVAKVTSTEDYPWARSEDERRDFFMRLLSRWGEGGNLEEYAPSVAGDEHWRQWWGRLERHAATPSTVLALMRAHAETDVRDVLPTIRVPTLVLHRSEDSNFEAGHGRYIAERIPGAKLVELPGGDHIPMAGDYDAILDEIEEFVTGARPAGEPNRVLATVLFTDIVDSTKRAAELGDREWRNLLTAHDDVVRRELERFRGREVKTVGDGFLAIFDGPARAIRCAVAIRDAVEGMGLPIRAGLHTGECELIGDDVAGMAVHIAARVVEEAEEGEVLASRTVRDLVAGSGIGFFDKGSWGLRGVPGEWQLLRVLS
jgi:class 3 adenylate cyclase